MLGGFAANVVLLTMKWARVSLTLALFTVVGAFGQSAAFEVASVRLNKSGSGSSRFNSTKGSVHSTNVSLRDLI